MSESSSSFLSGAAKSTLITGDFVGTVIEDQTLRATGDLDASKSSISNKGKVTERAVEFQEIEGKKGQYGTFAIEEDGSWSYKLKNTLDGVQSLAEGEVVTEVFKVVTETGAISYVTINVVGTNDIPVLTGSTTGALTEDDATSIASGKITVADVDHGQSFVQALNQAGQYGAFSIDANGNWTYTLDNGSASTQALAAGEIVTETFIVTSLDGTVTQNVTVTITGTNDAPVITSAAQTGAVEEDGALTTSGQVVATDVDHGAVLTFTGNADGAYGGFVVDAATGAWTYSLNSDSVQSLAAGETRTETFTVTVTDQFGASVTQDVIVTITGTNDAPVITSAVQAGAVVEDGALTATGQVTSSDVDNGATATFSGNAAGTYGGFAVDAATGEWTYTLNNAVAQALAAGESVTETFTVTVTDDQGATATQDVTVTITGTNDAPVITSAAQAGAVVEDGAVTATGQVTDSDVDNGATATFSGNAAGTYGGFAVDAATGAWTYTLNNAVAQALAAGESVTETFTVTVTDDQGATATQDVTVTITGTNDAPVVTSAEQAGAVVEDGAVTATGQVTASDVDNGATATFSGNANGSYGGFAVDAATGAWTYTLNNAIAQALAAGEVKTETFNVTVTDDKGATATQSVTVTITGTNDAPVITSAAQAGAVVEDGAVTATGQVTASDVDNGATAIFSGDANGNYGSFAVSAATGAWTYTLNNAVAQSLAAGEALTETFAVTVTDDQGVAATQEVTITITGTNDAPVITSGVQLGAVVEDGALTATGQVTASDVDNGATATFSGNVAGTYGGFAVDAATGEWTYTLNNTVAQALAAGEFVTETFTVTVTDDQGEITTQDVTLTTTGTNDTATISGVSSGTVTEDQNGVTSGALLVSDADAGQSFIQPVENLHGLYGTISVDANGQWSYLLDNSSVQHLSAGQSVVDNFTVTSADGSAQRVIGVVVLGSNDAPIAGVDNVLTGTITAPANAVAGTTMTAVAASYLTAGNSLINGLGGAQGYGEQNVAIGDDNSTGAIDIQSVFGAGGVNFFGTTYSSLFINNNGNVTFGYANGQFTPSTINGGLNNPTIAPFWADVDTRGGAAAVTPGGTSTGSNLVQYDLDPVNHVMTITWNDVGYYAAGTNRLNAFQLQLVGTGNGNFDIVFRYENVNWTAGSASGGSGGLGGTAARAGFSAGDGVHFYELPQSGFQAAMLGLPSAPGNTGIPGVDVFHVLNGQVQSSELTQTGHFTFTDIDLADIHSVQSVTYTGVGSALGYLTFVKLADTTGSGVGGNFEWTYHINSGAVPHAGKVESFNVIVSDGKGGSFTETVSVQLNGANTAPTFDAAAAAALPNASEDSTYLVSATQLLSGWSDSDADVLTVSHLTATNGVVVDNGDGTFSITPNANFNGNISLSYDVSDGRATVAATRQLAVNAVNDAATISGTHAGDLTEDSGNYSVAGSLSVADIDQGQAYVQAINAQSSAYGSFSIDANGNWNYVLNNGASAVQALAAGQSVTDNFVVYSLDGTASQVVSLTVTGTNDTANAIILPHAVNFVDGGAAVAVASAIAVSDVDNSALTGAQVVISNGLTTGDVLNFAVAAGSGITGAYDTATGTLNLTGTATLADYQAVLASITYSNTTTNPSAIDAALVAQAPTRTVSISLNDGLAWGPTSEQSVNITPVNSAPNTSVPATQNYTAAGAHAVNGISVSDPDGSGLPVSVTLSVAHGVLNVTSAVAGGLTVADIAGNGSGAVTLTGTVSAINATLAALGGLSYQANNGFGGIDQLSVVTSDLSNGAPGGAPLISSATVDLVSPTLSIPAVSLAQVAAGQGGFALNGVANSNAGYSVSNAGDVNGDGFADLIVGAYAANGYAGQSYVVFGKADGTAVNLAQVAAGQGGFALNGFQSYSYSGYSVSNAGDVNGDGLSDVIVGAFAGNNAAGQSYVVFGKANGTAVNLAQVAAGQGGFALNGVTVSDYSGYSVSNAGDVNGDGFADLIVGARGPNGNAGQSYVVFGKANGTAVSLAQVVAGQGGFALNGFGSYSYSGYSVSTAGDVNGDGLSDLIVGAFGANGYAGQSYVVFGKADGTAVNLAQVAAGQGGFALNSFGSYSYSGYSVSTAGDVNGDGLSDLIVGAYATNGFAGQSYVVFGKADGTAVNLAQVAAGQGGFALNGFGSYSYSGHSVSTAGDVNGDGLSDLIVGAQGVNGNAGQSYVVFGKADGTAVSLAQVAAGQGGFALNGVANSNAGYSVSNAGDVNGDGFADLIVGAYGANGYAGQSYVVFGGNFTNSVTYLGDRSGGNQYDTLTGTSGADCMNGMTGNDTLHGNGGADVMYGGSGYDVLGISDAGFALIDGGSAPWNGYGIGDVIAFENTLGMTLDLTSIPDSRLAGIEGFNMRNNVADHLIMNKTDMLNLSETSNQVIVYGNAGDTLVANFGGAGYTVGADQGVNGTLCHTYISGHLTLLVDTNIASTTLLG